MSDSLHNLRVFSYLVAEKAPLYRAVMATFMEQRDRFALHLRSAEIEAWVGTRRPDLAGGAPIDAVLAQLCEWGNLERHQDTAEVRTVEEFYRPRYLYQLTREGEEAERAITRYLAAVVEGGELQTAALVDIRRLLGELELLSRSAAIDEGKAYDAFTQLRTRFEELTARAQTFMSSLQRSVEPGGLESAEEGLLRYKEILIAYLQRFVLELRNSSSEVSVRLMATEAGRFEELLAAVARRELADALDRGDASLKAAAEQWRLRWQGLRSWFVGEGHQPPRAEVLRRKALSAIPKLLAAIGRLNDRRVSRTDRVADLRTLARWFAETDTDAQAHRLWMAAFGLTPSRHLTIDADTLAAREAYPVRSRTSWRDAPPIVIAPRLRQIGRYTRKGAGRSVLDRTSEKAYLAAMAREEGAQLEAARQELLRRGPTRLSALGRLSGPGFGLFLDLLGDALAAKARADLPVEVQSTDGTLRIRLEPTGDGAGMVIETPDGAFSGPDHFIRIFEAAEESQAEPASLRPEKAADAPEAVP